MPQPKTSSLASIQQQAGLQQQQQRPLTVPQMLERYKAQIAMALPRHMSADRMTRIALTAFNSTPALQRCSPTSVMAAIVISAQLGLEIGQLGQAYLIPYGTNCTFVPGWKGLVDLVNRAGRSSIITGAVYEGDEFDYERGSANRITHREKWETEKLTHVYAIGRVKGSELDVIEVWPKAKVERHRDRYNKVGQRHYSFQHFEAYARKVVLLQVLKYLPSSVEMAQAYEYEISAEKGTQTLTMEALSSNAIPMAPEPDEQTIDAPASDPVPDFEYTPNPDAEDAG